MKRAVVICILAGLLLLTACGSGSSGATPVGAGQGNFSKASLKGQYAYQIAGYDLTSGAPYREAGYFVADGNGNLTSGSDDFSEPTTGGVQNASTTGTYSIANDGTGTLILSTASGALRFSLTMVSNSEVLMNEADSGAFIAAGRADLQAPSALSSVPAGTFVFRIHSCVSCSGSDSASLVGAMTVAGGNVSGSDDVLRGGIFDPGSTGGGPLAITGSLNTPTSNGRGTGSITDASGTVNFIYYIVDSKTLRFLVSDSGVIGLGSAEAQSGTFSSSSLKGSYVFGSRADDATAGINAQNTVGVFTAGGNGTISTGTLDSVQDGNPSSQVGLSGSYAVLSNGRAVVKLGTIQQVCWMVNASRGFFLTDDSTKVEDGTLDQQQGSFSNGSLSGQYAFSMDGLEFTNNGTVALTQVGWIVWNGSGTLTWSETVNNSSSGSGPSGNLPGTYSVSSNGRTTAAVNTLSNNIVVYLVSGSKGYMLQNDTGVEIVGTMAAQKSP